MARPDPKGGIVSNGDAETKQSRINLECVRRVALMSRSKTSKLSLCVKCYEGFGGALFTLLGGSGMVVILVRKAWMPHFYLPGEKCGWRNSSAGVKIVSTHSGHSGVGEQGRRAVRSMCANANRCECYACMCVYIYYIYIYIYIRVHTFV